MKWILLIIIVLALAGFVALRMSRQGHTSTGGSHRPGQGARPPGTPGHNPDMPGTTDASFIGGTGTPGTAQPGNPDVDWRAGDAGSGPAETRPEQRGPDDRPAT